MNTSVKQWYTQEYPSDTLGRDIPEDLTFQKVFETLKYGYSIYDIMPSDSVLRERLFHKLADLTEYSFNDYYEMWLNS